VIEKSCGTLIGQKTMYVNIPANDSKSMIKKTVNCSWKWYLSYKKSSTLAYGKTKL